MSAALDGLRQLHDEPLAEVTAADDDDDLGHWICCDSEHVTLCGRVSGNDVVDDAEPDCPECVALNEIDMTVFAGTEHCVVCPLNCRREP